MLKDRKKNQMIHNEVMQNLQFLQQDINVHLLQDQKKIDEANKNMESALNDMDGAQEQLNKKRNKLMSSFNKMLPWFLCLIVMVTIVFYSML